MQGQPRAHAEQLTKSKSKPLPAAGCSGERRRRAKPGQGGFASHLRLRLHSCKGMDAAFKVPMGEARASWRSRANLAKVRPRFDWGRLILLLVCAGPLGGADAPRRRRFPTAAGAQQPLAMAPPGTVSCLLELLASDGHARWEPSSTDVFIFDPFRRPAGRESAP